MKKRRERSTAATLPQVDGRGNPLSVGQRVRVVGVPVLHGEQFLRESLPVFQRLVGTYHRIRDFDETGCAELFVRFRKGPHRGLHFVWIEPNLLQLPIKRAGRRQLPRRRFTPAAAT